MAPPYGFHTTATEVATDLAANIRGKVVLTTGVTPNSLGSHFVETIAAHSPSLLILASRNEETIKTTTAAIAKINPSVQVRAIIVDLGSLASVRKAAAEVVTMTKDGIMIDVLMLNAGIMACSYGKTTDGFERQFGTNHLGHFVFGNRIVPTMIGPGRKPRVVVVSSEGHQLGPVRFADPGFGDGEHYDKWRAYGQAKSANNLYALALAERLGDKGLFSFSLHPGAITTNLVRHIDIQGDDFKGLLETFRSLGNPQGFPDWWEKTPSKTLDEGTSTHIIAAFGDGLENHNGKFLRDAQICSWDLVSAWARPIFIWQRRLIIARLNFS